MNAKAIRGKAFYDVNTKTGIMFGTLLVKAGLTPLIEGENT